eukprot:scaffold254473_cov32-Tisochrysis_lutea.AAC.5
MRRVTAGAMAHHGATRQTRGSYRRTTRYTVEPSCVASSFELSLPLVHMREAPPLPPGSIGGPLDGTRCQINLAKLTASASASVAAQF